MALDFMGTDPRQVLAPISLTAHLTGGVGWFLLKISRVVTGAKVAKGGSVTLLGGAMRGTFTTLSPGVMLLFR